MTSGRRASFSLLVAVSLLGISRALPASGFGLWLRLAAATLLLLAPGRLLARTLGQRGASAALAWSTALVAAAMALTFALRSSFDLTLGLVLGAGAVALVACQVANCNFVRQASAGRVPRGRGLVVLAGLGLGGAVWFVEGALVGDALFHLGRVRKLDDLGSLSLHAVDEFAHGGLHPGYAFPLWHGCLALVAKLAGVDPTLVVEHESSLLVPLALLVALELGIAVFESAWLGLATMLGQAAMIVLAPGNGGAYTVLAEPGTAARQLLVPAATALFFLFVRDPSWPLGLTLAAVAADLSFVHPTYALFLALALAAFVGARLLLARGADLRSGIGALAAFGAPMLLVFAWLRPIVDQTLSVNPGPRELRRALHAYAGDLTIASTTSYHLAPEVVARAGPVAVAALVATPLALLASRRRWAAFVLGATVVVLVLELWGALFPHFANAVSLSQARRAAGFVPFAVAFAGAAAVLARASRLLALPVALAAGIALELAYPGDFGVRTAHHGPAAATWIALFGGLAALVAGAALAWTKRAPRALERPGPLAALAAALFVLPIAVHGFSHWSTTTTRDRYALSPGLIRFLQHDVPARSVVFADLETSYRVCAFAPVYVVAAPPAHVANTRPNRIRARRAAVLHFFGPRKADLAIPRSWGAGWLVLKRHEPVRAVERQGLRPVYEDDRYVVFRL
jgi:hypothetical protein